MKILSGQQIREADLHTIRKEQISSDLLMERAGIALFNWLHARLQGAPVAIHIFCGTGNNGGDGLVLARHLREHGYAIEVYIVNYREERSRDFLINLDRLKDRKVWPQVINKGIPLPSIGQEDILVDAIFGTGLNRTPEAWVSSLLNHLNGSGAAILSVDIPSGLFVDGIFKDPEAIIRANYVLTFQFPKLVFFLPQTGIYCGNWEVLDIGLDPDYIAALEVSYELIDKNVVNDLYRPRKKFSHKGTYGHSLIIGGSYGKIGAVKLAAEACLRTGSGLVTALVPGCGYDALQTALPEAMVLTDPDKAQLTDLQVDLKPTAIGLGIGMGTAHETIEAVNAFLKVNKRPLVVDADGLNMLALKKEMLQLLPPQTILTPHPKELERLIGSWKDDFDKLDKAIKFSLRYQCILVLKGAHSIVLSEGKGYVNITGNPGMATAGSGDVLTGIITGLLAQGYAPWEAAVFGVFLHGSAGDSAAGTTGEEALIASDITRNLGNAYALIRQQDMPEPSEPETREE